jgi:hypothetical protein
LWKEVFLFHLGPNVLDYLFDFHNEASKVERFYPFIGEDEVIPLEDLAAHDFS